MRVRVLGGLELEVDGTVLSPPSGQVGSLLRALLVRPNEVRSTESLCEMLWPDSSLDAARPRLHVTVSRLRSLLDTGAALSGESLRIDKEDDGYRLHATATFLDRVAFEAHAAEALANGDSSAVERALKVWSGEPYAGFEWTADVRTERSRLADLHRRLVEAKLNTDSTPGEGYLRAKFRAPHLAHESLLPRTELMEAAPRVGDVTVLAVTAATGFGKSVFLSQWSQRQSVPVVWVSLGKEDNDPIRFWSGVVGSIIETGRPDLDSAIGELRAGSSVFMEALIAVLEEAETPLALVLDDFHLVTNPVVHAQLDLLLSALPESSTTAFGSRVELPLTVGLLGVTGRVHRLTGVDLRFTVDEVEELVGDRDRAEWLWTVTEGWPVAVVALRRSDATEAEGSAPKEMGRYLVQEIVDSVPEDTARFMMEVAHLDRFNTSLCDAVTSRDNSRELISWLQQHQLFVTEAGTDGGWYRLHPLVAAELRSRAEADATVDTRQFYRRSSQWFLDQGMADESLHYAVQAADKDLVAATAGEVLLGTALRQETFACLKWLQAVPPDYLVDDPRGHAVAVILSVLWGPLDVRRSWAASRMVHFGGEDDRVLTFHDAVVAMREGRAGESIASLERVVNEAGDYAAEIAPDLASMMVGVAFANLVEARMFHDSLTSDDPIFASAIAMIRPAAPLVAAYLQAAWSLVAFFDGSFDLADSLAEDFYQSRRIHEVTFLPTPENSLVGAIAAARRSTDPAHLRRVAEGLDHPHNLYMRIGSQTWAAANRLVAAAIYRRAGRVADAARQQRKAEGLLRTFPDAPFLNRLASSVDAVVSASSQPQRAILELLTEKEKAVLSYLVTDLTSQQIARELFVSPTTVRKHASSIYRKLGVNSRHGAVRKLFEADIDPSTL